MTSDKSVINIARAASRTQNWQIGGSGKVSMGSWLGVQASGDVKNAVSLSSQSSIQQASEATRKSSETLKTLHKVEVRTVAEEAKQWGITRKLKNPYRDRTMSVNVFQMVKRFSVETKLAGASAALMIRINEITFDDRFICSHVQFLRDKLFDKTLTEHLSDAIRAVQAPPNLNQANEYAKLALRYLFAVPHINELSNNIFHLKTRWGLGQPPGDTNDPATSFKFAGRDNSPGRHGYLDALKTGFGPIFATLNMFYNVWTETHHLEGYAIVIARALANSIRPAWEAYIRRASGWRR